MHAGHTPRSFGRAALVALAALGTLLVVGGSAVASWCETARAGSGLLLPLDSAASLGLGEAGDVEVVSVDVDMRDDGETTRYLLRNHGAARALVVAVPIVAAQDGDDSCARAPIRAAETTVAVGEAVVKGTLHATGDDPRLAWARAWGYDALHVVTLDLATGQEVALEHRAPSHYLRFASPSATGDSSRAVRWPLRGLERWRARAIGALRWSLALGSAGHCVATTLPGARYGEADGVLRGAARALSVDDGWTVVGLFVEWEPPLGHVDDVWLARGDDADALYPIVTAAEAAAEAGADVGAVLRPLANEEILSLYRGLLAQHARRRGPSRDPDELLCQEIDVTSFLESVGNRLTTLASRPVTVHWPGPRPSRPATLADFSGAGALRAMAAELDRRSVRHPPLPGVSVRKAPRSNRR